MLAVGRELLIGRTLNTNAHWVGGRLARLGTMLGEITTVDDDLGEISRAFRAIVARSPEFLVVVGGLGPTPDDMTLKGLAVGLGVKMKRSQKALELIRAHYAKRGLATIELTPARLKMSLLPARAEPVPNEVGTAPGVRFVAGKTVVYSLPGVPAEMRSIFRRSVEPEVKAKLGRMHRKYVRLRLEGMLESALAPLISAELRKHQDAYIKSHPRGIREGVSRIELDIAVVGKDVKRTEEAGESIIRDMEASIRSAGGNLWPAKERRW